MATDPSGMWGLPSWNDVSSSFQRATNFWGGAAAEAGTNISQGVSQSWNNVRQGLNDFGRSWDNATNFWSRELVQPLVNSANGAIQNSVNSYTDIVRDGQQRGGVIGTLEQGVGYFGGTLASVPGGIADTVGGFAKAHPVLTTRIAGVVRAGVGVFEIAGGVLTTGFGIGILPVVKGIDDLQTGIRQLFTGQDTKSLIHGAVENLTGSSKLAGFVDAGTGLGASSVAANSLKAAKLAVGESRADGLTAGAGQVEVGMKIPVNLRVNPRYPGPPNIIGAHPKNMNCVNCAVTVDNILNGGNLQSAVINRAGESIGNLQTLYGRNFIAVQSQIHIDVLMSQAGSGATGIVLGQRNNGMYHVFNVVNKEGGKFFIDGQNGRFIDTSNFNRFSLLRTN
jgi:hypothetical protein